MTCSIVRPRHRRLAPAWRAPGAIAALVLVVLGCNSSVNGGTLTGTWTGSNSEFSNVSLHLTQTNETLTGTASVTVAASSWTGSDLPLAGTDFANNVSFDITMPPVSGYSVVAFFGAQAGNALKGHIGAANDTMTLIRQ